MVDEKYRYYWDERREAINQSNVSFRIFDTAVVVLASVFFVASTAFALSSNPPPNFIVAACVYFFVSLAAILLSFLFSARAYRKYIAWLDADYSNDNQASGEVKYRNPWSATTTALNWISAFALFAGIFDIVYELIRRAA